MPTISQGQRFASVPAAYEWLNLATTLKELVDFADTYFAGSDPTVRDLTTDNAGASYLAVTAAGATRQGLVDLTTLGTQLAGSGLSWNDATKSLDAETADIDLIGAQLVSGQDWLTYDAGIHSLGWNSATLAGPGLMVNNGMMQIDPGDTYLYLTNLTASGKLNLHLVNVATQMASGTSGGIKSNGDGKLYIENLGGLTIGNDGIGVNFTTSAAAFAGTALGATGGSLHVNPGWGATTYLDTLAINLASLTHSGLTVTGTVGVNQQLLIWRGVPATTDGNQSRIGMTTGGGIWVDAEGLASTGLYASGNQLRVNYGAFLGTVSNGNGVGIELDYDELLTSLEGTTATTGLDSVAGASGYLKVDFGTVALQLATAATPGTVTRPFYQNGTLLEAHPIGLGNKVFDQTLGTKITLAGLSYNTGAGRLANNVVGQLTVSVAPATGSITSVAELVYASMGGSDQSNFSLGPGVVVAGDAIKFSQPCYIRRIWVVQKNTGVDAPVLKLFKGASEVMSLTVVGAFAETTTAGSEALRTFATTDALRLDYTPGSATWYTFGVEYELR
jgi:hypothetical protein